MSRNVSGRRSEISIALSNLTFLSSTFRNADLTAEYMSLLSEAYVRATGDVSGALEAGDASADLRLGAYKAAIEGKLSYNQGRNLSSYILHLRVKSLTVKALPLIRFSLSDRHFSQLSTVLISYPELVSFLFFFNF